MAPLVPALKLSMKRTQLRSSGTVVPPDVTHAMGTVSLPSGPVCRVKKAVIWSSMLLVLQGLSAKNSSTVAVGWASVMLFLAR
jgi:hypothetical protein